MKKIILTALAVSALMSAPAAADPTAMFNWTGFYVGADVGKLSGKGTETLVAPDVSTNPNSSGLLYGGHAGYRYQFATNWVAGVEGQLWGVRDFDGRASYPSTNSDGLLDVKHGYTALGTLGYTIHPQLLIYGAGGWSRLHYTECLTSPRGAPCFPNTNSAGDPSAFTWGGGVAILINSNLILRFQYLYADYGSRTHFSTVVSGNLTAVDLKTSAITAGLSWKFGN